MNISNEIEIDVRCAFGEVCDTHLFQFERKSESGLVACECVHTHSASKKKKGFSVKAISCSFIAGISSFRRMCVYMTFRFGDET